MTTQKKSETPSESLPGLRGDPATHRPDWQARIRIQTSPSERDKESRLYDSLVGNNPYVSKDRSLCHPWSGIEAFNLQRSGKFERIRFDEDNFVEGIPIKELEKYENKNMVYVVEASYQIQRELCRWVNEEMTKDTLLYYVYAPYACEGRLRILDTAFDNLITHLQWYKPEVANTLKTLYGQTNQQAKETDAYYRRLSQLPYYNEGNYNSGKVKALITRLIKKLRHIESMAYAELIGEKPTDIGSSGKTDLGRAERLAYQSYEYAIEKKPSFASDTDDAVYNWLQENGPNEYDLPNAKTWKRQVRTGRKHHGTQKNAPRVGRTGRSIAKVNQIEYDSSQKAD